MSLKLAIAQSMITDSVTANGKAARNLMRQAAKCESRLVHFPECALSGAIKSHVLDWQTFDWRCLSEELERIQELARELRLFVVLGSAVRESDQPDSPRNSMIVIDDHGRIAGRYDKRRCSNTEINGWFSPGKEACIFDVDGFRFGCINCIEIHFPELFAEYETLDVDCILFSAYSNDPMFWIEAQAHAAINCMWVSVATPASYALQLPGGLIGPNGYAVAQAEATTESNLVLAELDRSAPEFEIALTKARPWRRTAREGSIYHTAPPCTQKH